MKTINEKKGYQFSNGTGGKRWKRGNIMYSEGKQYNGNGPEHINCIVKTNLLTNQMSIATLEEHKKFLTEDSYKEFVLNQFVKLAEYI